MHRHDRVVACHPAFRRSVSVADNGRGTDTRYDAEGQPVKKPIMATKDLRFFDFPDAQQLFDGHPAGALSVVAALSPWLVHINRRRNGAWTQRNEYGVPVTGLDPIPHQDYTGTTVRFLAADSVRSMHGPQSRRGCWSAFPAWGSRRVVTWATASAPGRT